MKKTIDCSKCPKPEYCCQEGVSIDLEQAKRIVPLDLAGKFFCLERDEDFTSGYRIDTSPGSDPCTFLRPDGLCPIHIIDYSIKPTPCKEFPHDDEENDGLSSDVSYLCIMHKQKNKE